MWNFLLDNIGVVPCIALACQAIFCESVFHRKFCPHVLRTSVLQGRACFYRRETCLDIAIRTDGRSIFGLLCRGQCRHAAVSRRVNEASSVLYPRHFLTLLVPLREGNRLFLSSDRRLLQMTVRFLRAFWRVGEEAEVLTHCCVCHRLVVFFNVWFVCLF